MELFTKMLIIIAALLVFQYVLRLAVYAWTYDHEAEQVLDYLCTKRTVLGLRMLHRQVILDALVMIGLVIYSLSDKWAPLDIVLGLFTYEVLFVFMGSIVRHTYVQLPFQDPHAAGGLLRIPAKE